MTRIPSKLGANLGSSRFAPTHGRAAGQSHSLVLKADGTVFAWGSNSPYWGGYAGQSVVPADLKDVVAIAAGASHSLALKSDGTVVAWGLNNFGQGSVPAGLTGVVAISAGAYHNLALKSDGTIVAWGRNYEGQCAVPAELTGVVAIAAGYTQSLALKADGSVVVMANNAQENSVPSGLGSVVAIASGDQHSLALEHLSAPKIISDISGQTVNQDDPVTFSVKASGGLLSFQWKKDGQDIDGATQADFSLSHVDIGDLGVYSVTISNPLGSVSSQGATLSIPIGTGSAEEVRYYQGTLTGMINPNGSDTKYYFEYGETGDYGSRTAFFSAGSGTSLESVSAVVNGLKPDTTYYYRLVAVSSSGTVYGPERSFNSDTRCPGLGLYLPLRASYQSTVVRGKLNPKGLATTYYFEYGVTAYDHKTPNFKAGSGKAEIPFNIAISGLIPGTSYHGRIVSENSYGRSWSYDHVFTTLDASIDLVALKGGAVAGITETQATFSALGNPVLNANGDVYFSATIQGVGLSANLNRGIFDEYGNCIVGTLRYAPLAGGKRGVFKSLNDPVSNNCGQIAFIGTLVPDGSEVTPATATGIWSDLSGTLVPVIRTGAGVPISGGTAKIATLTQFALPDEGGVIFAAKLAIQNGLVDATSNEGIWGVDANGSLREIVRKGESLAGNQIAALSLFTPAAYAAGQTRGFTNAGDVAFSATFADGSQGIYTVTSGSGCEQVAKQNELTDSSGAKFISFSSPAMNALGQVVFKAGAIDTPSSSTKGYTGIWLDSGSTRELIARTGIPRPGMFAILNDPVCNNSGEVAFLGILKPDGKGLTASNSTAIWLTTSGSTMRAVAHTQMQAPDCAEGAVFSGFRQFALPDQGGMVILADLSGTGVAASNNQGIWAVNSAGYLRLVVRKGDSQAVGERFKTIAALSIFVPTQDSKGQARSFNPHGDLIYKATFTDKTEAIYRVLFP